MIELDGTAMNRPRLDVLWRTDGHKAEAGQVVVVADVLRASTNIITAFSMGATQCRVVTDVEQSREAAEKEGAVLVGERDNVKVAGFDFGNSPVELDASRIEGAKLVFTSTNFPHAVEAAAGAGVILVGALVNVSAVCEKAMEWADRLEADISIMLAGEATQRHAAEDQYFAARAADILAEQCELSDAAAKIAAEMGPMNEQDVITFSTHAWSLIEDGFEQDVYFSFAVDRFKNVPRFEQGVIIAG